MAKLLRSHSPISVALVLFHPITKVSLMVFLDIYDFIASAVPAFTISVGVFVAALAIFVILLLPTFAVFELPLKLCPV